VLTGIVCRLAGILVSDRVISSCCETSSKPSSVSADTPFRAKGFRLQLSFL